MKSPEFEKWSRVWCQNNKFSFTPFIEWSEMTAKAFSDFTRNHLKGVNELYKVQAEYLDRLHHVKSFEDFSEAHRQGVEKIGPMVAEYNQTMLGTVLDKTAEYQRWFEKNMAQHWEHTKDVTEKAQ